MKNWRQCLCMAVVTVLASNVSAALSATDNDAQMAESQWRYVDWNTPKSAWNSSLQRLWQLTDNADYAGADQFLANWLQRDIEQALLALPHLAFYEQSGVTGHSFLPLYSQTFMTQMTPPEALSTLRMLNTNTAPVLQVSRDVVLFWWQQDPHGFSQWLSQHASFNDNRLLDPLLESLQRPADYALLLDAFDQWPVTTPNVMGYYALLLSRYQPAQRDALIARSLAMRQRFGEVDPRYLASVFVLAYVFFQQADYTQAIAWLDRARVGDLEAFSDSLRELILNVPPQSPRALTVFRDYVATLDDIHPDYDAEIRGLVAGPMSTREVSL